MKSVLAFLCLAMGALALAADHPRVYFSAADLPRLRRKAAEVKWAGDIVRGWHREVDSAVLRHADDPSFAPSRLQMNWTEGKRYTKAWTQGNFIPRREGNAKYPTIRIAYARTWGDCPYRSVSWEKNPPYTTDDGVFLNDKPTEFPGNLVPVTHSGMAAELINERLLDLAYKSAILHSLEGDARYAKFAADIVWTLVRGGAQQEEVNPGATDNCGFLSWETLGDTRRYWTIPLVWDMLYDYFHKTYFTSEEFTKGIKGEMWCPGHKEGADWAARQFEIFFKKFIDNKLTRGGGLVGNWNLNEQQSAMLYALALDDDKAYADGRGRKYYVRKLVKGPTTERHGAYLDVLRANIEESTGMWPEAPGGYGQGSIAQLVKFGFIYWKNGLDVLSRDPLLFKASRAMPQMIFPNGYVTNVGDSSYHRIFTDQLELMAAYADAKGDRELLERCAGLIKLAGGRCAKDDIAFFFYLPELPPVDTPKLSRVSYAPCYPVIMERNPSKSCDAADALAFSLAGFAEKMGHRHPNGLSVELYGRGEILAPDTGAGSNYWSADTHEYYRHVAAHNTVAVNGQGLDDRREMVFDIKAAEPSVKAGEDVFASLSRHRQFVDVESVYDTGSVKARQRRTVAIVRSGTKTGYYVDIFRSKVTEGEEKYHDYIFHCLGEWGMGNGERGMGKLNPKSGKGYGYFKTLGTMSGDFAADFDYGGGIVMRAFVANGGEGREAYALEGPKVFRHYDRKVSEKPCPALLVRQNGEAWRRPFVAVYEPSGKGVDAMIESVASEPLKGDPEGVRITVQYKNPSRRDVITHSMTAGFSVVAYRDGKAVDGYRPK